MKPAPGTRKLGTAVLGNQGGLKKNSSPPPNLAKYRSRQKYKAKTLRSVAQPNSGRCQEATDQFQDLNKNQLMSSYKIGFHTHNTQ